MAMSAPNLPAGYTTAQTSRVAESLVLPLHGLGAAGAPAPGLPSTGAGAPAMMSAGNGARPGGMRAARPAASRGAASPTRSDRPHKCPVAGCNYSAKGTGHLKRHIRTHTGEKPFKCPWDGCSYASSQSTHLTAHIRKHTGERPFTCPVVGCTYSAARSWHVTRHMKRQHPTELDAQAQWAAQPGEQSVPGRVMWSKRHLAPNASQPWEPQANAAGAATNGDISAAAAVAAADAARAEAAKQAAAAQAAMQQAALAKAKSERAQDAMKQAAAAEVAALAAATKKQDSDG